MGLTKALVGLTKAHLGLAKARLDKSQATAWFDKSHATTGLGLVEKERER